LPHSRPRREDSLFRKNVERRYILLSIGYKDPGSTIRLSHCYIECNEVG